MIYVQRYCFLVSIKGQMCVNKKERPELYENWRYLKHLHTQIVNKPDIWIIVRDIYLLEVKPFIKRLDKM